MTKKNKHSIMEINKENIKTLFKDKKVLSQIDALTEQQIDTIAKKVGMTYMNEGNFWEDLEFLTKQYLKKKGG